ncbi:MAG TPA: hypothetical protein PKU69_00810 [Bacillota bacterium]|nr:hypothetical protein [Bacillota bacterium]
MKINQKILGISFASLTIILVIVGAFILPDQVVIQMTIGADPFTTVSKPVALILIGILGIGGGVFTITNKDNPKNYRSYLVLLILAIVFALIFVFNL